MATQPTVLLRSRREGWVRKGQAEAQIGRTWARPQPPLIDGRHWSGLSIGALIEPAMGLYPIRATYLATL